MMTPKERAAMQQALEALEAEFYDDVKQSKLSKAITALQEAIDQHEPHEECECNACLNYFTDKVHKEALEHVTDGSPCWCNPELNYKDLETGAEVWVHKELQMTKEEIIEACKNSLNIYSFTAEALEKLIEAVRVEAPVRTKDLTEPLLDELRECRDLLMCFESCSRNNFENLAYERVQAIDAVIAADREKNK